MRVLCSIPTKGRYDTTLALAIQAVANQTRPVDKLVIFDDNDEPKDLREVQHYRYLFHMLDCKGIAWEFVFAHKKGQHFSHQMANTMGYDWVWRVDDDCIPEPNVLENLCGNIAADVGAIAGSILTPPFSSLPPLSGKIDDINDQSIQWDYIKTRREVDHLHCSFLYRAGVYDYNLGLSKVAHREETLFTYGLKQKGYKNLLIPNTVTWHLKNAQGGIRTEVAEMFMHDEYIFSNFMQYKDNTIVVLDSGMGDHLVFRKMMHEIKNPVIFTCHPDIVPGRSIEEAYRLFGSIDQWNIYSKMDQWKWKEPLIDAFRKLYL